MYLFATTKTGPGYLQHLLAIWQVEKGSTGDLHIERQIMITFAVLQSTKRIQPMIRFLLISLLSLPSVNSLHDCWFCIADRLFSFVSADFAKEAAVFVLS